jgi:hypothetical protein
MWSIRALSLQTRGAGETLLFSSLRGDDLTDPDGVE